MFADGETAVERTRAMFKHCRRFFRNCGLHVGLMLVRCEQRLFDEGNYFVEHGRVACHADVERGDKRQPDEIVRDSGTHAASTRRMPPVLYVALFDLMAAGKDDLLSRDVRI